MPIVKVCSGCNGRYDPSKLKNGRCEKCRKEHTRRYDRYERDQEAVAFYNSTRWRKLAKLILHRDPVCKECEKKGISEPSTLAAHIEPRKQRPDLEMDEANIRGLCHSCHARETVERGEGLNR